MKPESTYQNQGFTLLEVIMSLGIFAFAITVIIASIGSSAGSAASDARRTQAAEILDSCLQDLSLSPAAINSKTPMFQLEPIAWTAEPAKLELWFDTSGNQVAGTQDAFYKCEIISTKDSSAPLGNLNGRIAWPAKRGQGAPDGQVELFTSILLP